MKHVSWNLPNSYPAKYLAKWLKIWYTVVCLELSQDRIRRKKQKVFMGMHFGFDRYFELRIASDGFSSAILKNEK